VLIMGGRKVHGYEVPRYTKQEIQDLFKISDKDPVYTTLRGENAWIIPFISEEVDALYFKVSNGTSIETVVQSRVAEAVKKKFGRTPWYDALNHAGLTVNGQVKNFLVALRTYAGQKTCDEITVILKGSKAQSNSGLWIEGYAIYLTNFHTKVSVKCYDVNELASVSYYNIPYGEKVHEVKVEHISSMYHGSASDCDVFVDDAYIQGTVPVTPMSEYWSLKTFGAGSHFFSVTESRVFSHQLEQTSLIKNCYCPVCELMSSLCTTFGQYHSLRGLLVSYGAPICGCVEFKGDQQAKAHLRVELHSAPSVILVEPYQRRAALSLIDEEKIDGISPYQIAIGKGKLKDAKYVHGMGFQSYAKSNTYEHFAGKKIRFAGVNPEVLGTTPVSREKGPPDIVIAQNSTAALIIPAPEIWTVADELPGYVLLPENLGPYRRFLRKKKKKNTFLSEFSDIGGVDITKEDVAKFLYVGGRYKVSQTQVTLKSLQLTPPVLDLKGEITEKVAPIYYFELSKLAFKHRYPVVDSATERYVKAIVSESKILCSDIRYLTFNKKTRTFEVHRTKMRPICAMFHSRIVEGVYYENGFDDALRLLMSGIDPDPGPDNAIKMLKSGGEIHPGPDDSEDWDRTFMVFRALYRYRYYYVFENRIEIRSPFYYSVSLAGGPLDVIDSAIQIAAVYRGRMELIGRNCLADLYLAGRVRRYDGDEGSGRSVEEAHYELQGVED